ISLAADAPLSLRRRGAAPRRVHRWVALRPRRYAGAGRRRLRHAGPVRVDVLRRRRLLRHRPLSPRLPAGAMPRLPPRWQAETAAHAAGSYRLQAPGIGMLPNAPAPGLSG